jgi:very-short-patch-repair endonuclease
MENLMDYTNRIARENYIWWMTGNPEIAPAEPEVLPKPGPTVVPRPDEDDNPWVFPQPSINPTPKGFKVPVPIIVILCFFLIFINKNIMATHFDTRSFIEKSNKIHENKYDYSLVEYKNAHSKVKIICPEHGQFEQAAYTHIRGTGCKNCYHEHKAGNSQRLSNLEFISQSKKIHNNKYDYSLSRYINSKLKIKIICPIHGQFMQTPGKHLSGQGCRKCGQEILKNYQRKTQDNFIKESIKIHGKKYDYSLVQYINVQTKIKIICPVHGVWEQKPNKHLSGQGCRKCSGSYKLTTENFIKRSTEIHNSKYNYSLSVYKDHYKKVKIKCPIHGAFEQGAGSHLSGIGCPKCQDSKGEKEIFKILTEKGLIFETQKSFEGCVYKNRLRFDFYIPSLNICIEYDGEQHFKPIPYYGGQENFELIKKKDNIKTKFCKDNGIQLIRIRFDDNILDKLCLS